MRHLTHIGFLLLVWLAAAGYLAMGAYNNLTPQLKALEQIQ